MICKSCGMQVQDNLKFCPYCGGQTDNPVPTTNQYNMNQTNMANNNIPNQINNYQNIPNNYNQNMTPMSPYTKPEKKKNNLWIIIGVILVVVLVGIIAISMMNHKTEDEVKEEPEVKEETTTQEKKYITLSGYTYEVPDNYDATLSNNRIQLISNDNKNIILVGIIDGNYDTISSSQSYIKTYMQNAGYTVNTIGNRTIDGVDLIVAEVTLNGNNMILCYSKLDSTKVYTIGLANTSYTIDYSLLNVVVPFLKTAKVS